MPNIKVSEGQTPVDIALQQNGNFSSVFDFADLNGISITDLLTPEEVVQATDPKDEEVTKQFIEQWQKPVSSYEDDEILSADGVDFWAVDVDLISS